MSENRLRRRDCHFLGDRICACCIRLETRALPPLMASPFPTPSLMACLLRSIAPWLTSVPHQQQSSTASTLPSRGSTALRMDEKADSDQARELEETPPRGFVAEDMVDPTDGYAQQARSVPFLCCLAL